MRISFKVGGAIVSYLVSAVTFAFNAFNVFKGISWAWIAFISFLVFGGFVFWGWYEAENRARLLENERPSIVFSGFSPDASILRPINKRAFFTRIKFANNRAYPNGDNSTAHDLTAQIKIIDKNEQLVDAWEGRWANTDAPGSTGDIWIKNRINLPANNQMAILDIGYRLEGKNEFVGWDNTQHFNLKKRASLKPGDYKLEVMLGASNMELREFYFALTIPDIPQSEQNGLIIKFLGAKSLQELTGS